MEIKLDEYYQRINEYQTGEDYTPLKIVFHVDSPIYITSPYLNFDSILSYLCLRDALGELFYNLPSDVNLDLTSLKLPLKKTLDIYHSSVSQFTNPKLYKETIYKRFTDKQIHKVKSKRYKKIRVGSGYFKGFMIDLPALLTEDVTFYCNGDKNSINELLTHLTHLGKKPSIGGGHITDYKITNTSEDYSFYKDGQVMRPIPAQLGFDKFHIPLKDGMTLSRQAYKPPYWNNENVDMCYVPPSQISTIRT